MGSITCTTLFLLEMAAGGYVLERLLGPGEVRTLGLMIASQVGGARGVWQGESEPEGYLAVPADLESGSTLSGLEPWHREVPWDWGW